MKAPMNGAMENGAPDFRPSAPINEKKIGKTIPKSPTYMRNSY